VTRIYLERRDLGNDVLRFLDWLDESPLLGGVAAVEHRPPMDVVETAEAVEIVVDLPGVTADCLRIIFTSGTLVVAGRKGAPGCSHREAAFHLAERSFGRFACVVRPSSAIDAGRARAVLGAGELHVVLPRIEDRRGREIQIEIEPE